MDRLTAEERAQVRRVIAAMEQEATTATERVGVLLRGAAVEWRRELLSD